LKAVGNPNCGLIFSFGRPAMRVVAMMVWKRKGCSINNTSHKSSIVSPMATFKALSPLSPDAVRRDDTRQEFIIEKYVAMKYTSPEDKERILRESE